MAQEERQTGEIVLYQPDETIWLNRQQMALLYGRDTKTIGKYVTNTLKQELKDEPVGAKFATTTTYGKTYKNLLFTDNPAKKNQKVCIIQKKDLFLQCQNNVLATPLNAGSKTEPTLLHLKVTFR
ncbi:MAG: hypothetical protein IJV44_03630 [Prevotella sp.]|nr:hypothetical protein [Prevotella sp.]